MVPLQEYSISTTAVGVPTTTATVVACVLQ